MRRDLVDHANRSIQWDWSDVLVAGVRDDRHATMVGRSIAELALGRDADALDTFLDLALAEDLETLFVIDA